MSKIHAILERFWLFVAIFGSVVTLWYTFEDGFIKTRFIWLIVGIVWAMYFVRRGIRKRMEIHAKNVTTKNKK